MREGKSGEFITRGRESDFRLSVTRFYAKTGSRTISPPRIAD